MYVEDITRFDVQFFWVSGNVSEVCSYVSSICQWVMFILHHIYMLHTSILQNFISHKNFHTILHASTAYLKLVFILEQVIKVYFEKWLSE